MDPDTILDMVKGGAILLIGGYVILLIAHTLFGTPDPNALF